MRGGGTAAALVGRSRRPGAPLPVGSSVADIMVSHREKMACGAWNEENMYHSFPAFGMSKVSVM